MHSHVYIPMCALLIINQVQSLDLRSDRSFHDVSRDLNAYKTVIIIKVLTQVYAPCGCF